MPACVSPSVCPPASLSVSVFSACVVMGGVHVWRGRGAFGVAGERALARLEKEFKVTLRDKDKLSEKKDPPPSRKGKTR